MSRPDWNEEDRQTASFYSGLLQQHGNDARALNWGSRESQAVRFAALCGIGSLDGCSVLDVGCGLGDMWAWLRQQRTSARYIGIDISPEMISRARSLHPDAAFEVAAATDQAFPQPGAFDYVFASGIFYLRKANPEAYLEQAVSRMFNACRKGIAFNSLSLWAPKRDPDEFYADPCSTLEVCRRITRWVTLRHDYHPGDFTIYMRRDKSSS